MNIRKYELYMEESKVWESVYEYDITSSQDVYDYQTSPCIRLNQRDREHFIVIALNAKGKIIGYNESGIGDISSAPATPREVLKFAIIANAAGIILAHNHPSGSAEESSADIEATERIAEACNIIGIQLLDHLIIGAGCFKSFRASGLLTS